MKVWDRLLVALVGLALVAGAGYLGFATILLSPEDVLSVSANLGDLIGGRGRIEAGVGALAAAAVGARLVVVAVSRGRRERSLVTSTSLGDVSISLTAVENLVKRAARQVKGIREVETRVAVAEGHDSVGIQVDVLVGPDISIPDTCAEVQRKLADYVKETVGVPVSTVGVTVRNVSSAEARQRVG